MSISLPAVAISVVALVVWRITSYILSRRYLSYVPGPPRASWWMGNFGPFTDADGLPFHSALRKKYGAVARLEMLHEQHLSVFDPLALHHILIKDQSVYEESDVFLTTFQLAFGPSLLATEGETHKRQRKMLNPVFSMKHMREVYPILVPIAHQLRNVLEKELKGKEHVDVAKWLGRAALECIGQAGFGHSFHAFEDQANEYSETLRVLLLMLGQTDFLEVLMPLAVKLGPASLRRRLVKLIPSKFIQNLAGLVDAAENYAKAILHQKREFYGEREESAKPQTRKDIMSTLLKANSSVDGISSIPESELVAHVSTFIVAGHDTTKSVIVHALDVLSKHQDAQSRLREEIFAARKEHGELDYDTLMALPFLDAVCRETLRVYPPAVIIHRIPNKDVVLPLLWPIKSADGKTEIREIPLKKGTNVWLSVLGANMSKAIWGEDAEDWIPDRWLKPLPKSLDDARLPGVYSQMMTFLGGNRACIGLKFAEMEIKLMLFTLLEKLVFEPGPRVSWKIGVTQFPAVEQPGYEPGMLPLKVSCVSEPK